MPDGRPLLHLVYCNFALRPVPFVVAFVTYFIALYAMQALFLKRLTTVK